MHLIAEAALARIAASQHGVFTRQQAIDCGLTITRIDHYVEHGLWIRLYPGVYSHSATPDTWMRRQAAAVWWASPAAASGLAAAYLHELPGFDQPAPEIVTLNRKIVPHSGVKVHVTNWFAGGQVIRVRGIPTTSVERTLLDIAGLVPRRRAAIALDHALHLGLTTVGACDHCLYVTARRGRRGVATFRELVQSRWTLKEFPNSPLETLVYDVLVPTHLPAPTLQMSLMDSAGRFIARPDFVYPEWKVVVEGHSRRWHEGDEVESKDRAKHERLVSEGYEVIYVTWADAIRFHEGVVNRVEGALRRAGWEPGLEKPGTCRKFSSGPGGGR